MTETCQPFRGHHFHWASCPLGRGCPDFALDASEWNLAKTQRCDVSAVHLQRPSLTSGTKPTGGGETQRKHENTRFYGLYTKRWLTVPHRSSASEQKLQTNTRISCLQPGLREPPHPLRFRFLGDSVPLWYPHREIPPSRVHPSALTFCCFAEATWRVAWWNREPGLRTSSVIWAPSRCIRNIWWLKEFLWTAWRAHPSLDLRWQGDFGPSSACFP